MSKLTNIGRAFLAAGAIAASPTIACSAPEHCTLKGGTHAIKSVDGEPLKGLTEACATNKKLVFQCLVIGDGQTEGINKSELHCDDMGVKAKADQLIANSDGVSCNGSENPQDVVITCEE